MKARKQFITGVALAAVAAGAIAVAGCHKETHGDKYLAYAETAGKTVAYVVNLSDKFTDVGVKTNVLAVLDLVLPNIPKELTPASVTQELKGLKDLALSKLDIPEGIRPMVETAADVLVDLAGTGLQKIAEKYPTECSNSETYYAIVRKFADTLDDTLSRLSTTMLAAKDGADPYAYDTATGYIGKVDKAEYEDLVGALTGK